MRAAMRPKCWQSALFERHPQRTWRNRSEVLGVLPQGRGVHNLSRRHRGHRRRGVRMTTPENVEEPTVTDRQGDA